MVPAFSRALAGSANGLRSDPFLPQRSSRRRVEGLRPPIAFSCSRYPSALISRSPQTLRGRSDSNRSRQAWSSCSRPRFPRFSISAERPSMFDNEHFIRFPLLLRVDTHIARFAGYSQSLETTRAARLTFSPEKG